MQVRGAADALEVVVPVETAGDDDRVDVLALAEQVDHRGEDELVRRVEEVLRGQLADDLDDRVRAQQHRAEDTLPLRRVLREGRDEGAGILRKVRLRRRHVVVVEAGVTES